MNPGFFDGSKALSPLLIGVIPFGLVFGVVAADSVIGPWLGYATSLVIFAGAAQLATVQLLDEGVVGAVIVATALVINSRHVMYTRSARPPISASSPGGRATPSPTS